MLTTAQLRAARALLGISIENLSEASGFSADVILAAESSGSNVDRDIGERLRRILEAKGAVFVSEGQADASGAGVRLQPRAADEGLRPQNLNAANDG